MPICQNCKKRWSWSKTMKQIFRFRTKMNCYHCGDMQFQTQNSKYYQSMFTLLPLIFTPLIIVFNLSTIIFILINIVIIIGVILSLPFILKLSNDEEPLW